MRISVWSSDVCSSDLFPQLAGPIPLCSPEVTVLPTPDRKVLHHRPLGDATSTSFDAWCGMNTTTPSPPAKVLIVSPACRGSLQTAGLRVQSGSCRHPAGELSACVAYWGGKSACEHSPRPCLSGERKRGVWGKREPVRVK